MEKLKIGVEQLSESSSFVSIRHQRRWVEVERGNHKLAEVHFSIFQVTTKSEESQRTKSVNWESTFYWPFLENYIVVKYDWLRICSVMIKSWKFSIFIIAIFANGTLLLPDPVFWLIDSCCFPIWISEVSFLLTDFQFSILSFHFRTSAYYPAYLIFDLESGAMLDSEPRKKHLQGTHTHTAQHTIPHTFTLILSQREHLCHVKFWMQIIKILLQISILSCILALWSSPQERE